MPRVTRSPSRKPKDRGELGYATLSTRPLHMLVFLLPLMIAYEVGAFMYLTSNGSIDTIAAQRLVYKIFASLGGVLFHAPTFLLAAILVVWHLLLKDPWKVRAPVLLGMVLESCLWTLPVLVFGLLAQAAVSMEPAALADTVQNVRHYSWQARATLSIGAGLYEELLFRLVMIGAIHFVLVDLLRAKHAVGAFAAALVSSLAFAFYHDVSGPGGVNLRLVLFFTLAGLYFSTVFITRGFGVVVATHALYDIVALLVFTRER